MVRRHINVRWKLALRRVRQFVLLRVVHVDDTPHRLALGVALGVFVTFTPTIGAQMALVVALGWLLGANRVVGLPVVWISNPLTIVPIYYPSYVLGSLLLGHGGSQVNWGLLRVDHGGWWPNVVHFWRFAMEVAVPLWLGSVMVGLMLGGATYAVTRWVIRYYRQKRPLAGMKRVLQSKASALASGMELVEK